MKIDPLFPGNLKTDINILFYYLENFSFKLSCNFNLLCKK